MNRSDNQMTVNKLRRLMTVFTQKPLEQIDENFSFHDDVDIDQKEFQIRLIDVIRESFGEVISAKEIAEFNTLGDLVSFLDSLNLVTDVLLKKATLASMSHQ